MKFQITTDYAIRVVLYLAQHPGQVCGSREMAEKLCMTYSYMIKVTAKLKAAGFIESVQGPFGGYRLAISPFDITLYDIILAIEGKIQINRCLEDDHYCSRYNIDEQNHCPVHQSFQTLQNQMIEFLKSQRISKLSGMDT
ncbi:Rrf2 family transcriptional regulator [Lacrimispora amygdalina]|uniref:Rrf2 family transcriptional regulator n=1 Tax=Lacrimispora amygdalina TaxID=253257 RepID=A0A3E2NF17_9FIRM|nr:Rrf2 family transcriptional regulator [Clostridium indicum]RFZ79607.1 Rrf2 family transcriptional regulator [Clostridium indicum]